MKIHTASATVEEFGPLTKIVNDFTQTHSRLVAAGISSLSDWEPLAKFVDVAAFKRVGAYLEEFNWTEYLQFMTDWAGGTRFELTVFRISEVGNIVVQEIEERHYRGDEFIRKNVVAIYAFNEASKLCHLDIYEQAKDSGQWIKEAAKSAVASGHGSGAAP